MYNISDDVRYIGQFKQPIQDPERFNPSMFIGCDPLKRELDLILLTPGTFLHAFNFIKSIKTRYTRLFIPSLRPEFISDIFNIFMIFKKRDKPIQWVFPDEFNHYEFSLGQIKTDAYQNQFSSRLTISYIKNEDVDGVYNIIVNSIDASHYFSFYMTEAYLKELYNNKNYDFIHLPKSSTLYGGLSYDSALNINRKYYKKLVPYDFSSREEYYDFHESPFRY